MVTWLAADALENGLSLDDYLLQTVLRHKEQDGAGLEDSNQRRKRANAGTRIFDIQKGVKPDPEGRTSRDYVNSGRR